MKTGPNVAATTREDQASGADGTIPRGGRRGAPLPIRIEMGALRRALEDAVVLFILSTAVRAAGWG